MHQYLKNLLCEWSETTDSERSIQVAASTDCKRYVNKLIDIILPYSNQISIDVIMRNNIEELKIFFTKDNLAKHDEKRYSLRKDLNKTNKKLLQNLKFKLRKYFKP